MCIKQVQSYEFAGKLYAREIDAVTAALTEISAKLLKEHHANLAVGVIDQRKDIVKLLTRYDALTTAPEVTSEPKMSEAFINYNRHTKACRCRLTGLASDCNCPQDASR